MLTFVYAVLVVATIAQLLPLIPVLRLGARAPLPRKWMAAWSVTYFVVDLIQIAISRTGKENLWFITISQPLEDALLLWALSYWQTRPVFRIAFRVAVPLVVVIYLAIGFAAGELDSFKTFSGPFRGLVLLSASLFTLLSRVSVEPEGVWKKDWLWTTMGTTLYYGLHVATDPIVAALYERSVELAQLVYAVKSIGDVIAFALVWQGMRCPLQSTSSGST